MSRDPPTHLGSGSPSSADESPERLHDDALVARIRSARQRPGGLGDEVAREAIGQLLESYQNRVFAICLRVVGNRETAADLTQDVLLKVILGLEGYTGQSRLSTWVFRVALNCCMTHLRSARLRSHASLSAGTPENGGSHDPIEREQAPTLRVEHQDDRSGVLAALDRLDPEQRALLVLRDVHDMEYERLAEVLDVPIGTVKSRLFRARLALRAEIEQGGSASRESRK